MTIICQQCSRETISDDSNRCAWCGAPLHPRSEGEVLYSDHPDPIALAQQKIDEARTKKGLPNWKDGAAFRICPNCLKVVEGNSACSCVTGESAATDTQTPGMPLPRLGQDSVDGGLYGAHPDPIALAQQKIDEARTKKGLPNWKDGAAYTGEGDSKICSPSLSTFDLFDLPRFIDGASPRLRRIIDEASLAAIRYSKTHKFSFDDLHGAWVIFHYFKLPSGYDRDTCNILILLPPNYPTIPPDWFYIPNYLRLKNGRIPPHVHSGTGADPNFGYSGGTHDYRKAWGVSQEPPQLQNWHGACLHIHDWEPAPKILEGHNLIHVCELIYMALGRWSRG